MTISTLINELKLKLLTKNDYDDKNIDGCYIGDLLSWVMGRVKENDAWITIMSNVNIVAVATLTEASCIILAEGVLVESEIIDKANVQDVIILSSDKTAYELALMIGKK